MIFINPDAGVNRDIPNLDVAYASAKYSAPVVDFNTLQKPENRFLNYSGEDIVVSVQSRSLDHANRIMDEYKKKYPDASVKTLNGSLGVQCCYPFMHFADIFNLELEFGDDLKIPDYELFDSYEVFKKNWQSGKWFYTIMTTHGCPFPCKYCSSRETKYKKRSVEHCIEELRFAKEKYGIKNFCIIDDCFNVSKKRVINFCEQVKELDIQWFVANGLRADRFDESVAEALKDSGFINIMFGVESIHNDVLEASTKGETFEDIEKAVKIAQKYFEHVGGFFILALPASSYEKDVESIIWAYENNVTSHFSYYIPEEHLNDHIFYGDKAVPMADTYDKNKQKMLYKLTNYLRPGGFNIPIFSNWLRNREKEKLGKFIENYKKQHNLVNK